MTIEAEFAEMMPHVIEIRHLDTRGFYGSPSYPAAADITTQGLVVWGRDRAFNADGEEVALSGRVYLYGVHGVVASDQITLPDGSTPRIVMVERFADDKGDHNEVVGFA